MAVALPGTKEDTSVVGRGVTDGSPESEDTYVEFACANAVDSVDREVGNSVVDKTRESEVGSGKIVEIVPLDVEEASDEVGYGCKVVETPVE
jgi:hypothetical protein